MCNLNSTSDFGGGGAGRVGVSTVKTRGETNIRIFVGSGFKVGVRD